MLDITDPLILSCASLTTATLVIISWTGLVSLDVVFAKILNVRTESTSARLFESKRSVRNAFDDLGIGLPIVHAIVVLLKLLHTPVLYDKRNGINPYGLKNIIFAFYN